MDANLTGGRACSPAFPTPGDHGASHRDQWGGLLATRGSRRVLAQVSGDKCKDKGDNCNNNNDCCNNLKCKNGKCKKNN